MTRWRLCVALMVAEPVATEIDGIRRALGDTKIARIAPHITLVPPVNVHADVLNDALDIVRSTAARMKPLQLTIGPPSTFMPRNPVLELDVSGDSLDEVIALREALMKGPLDRDVTLPFVPHVTLKGRADDDQLEWCPQLLRHYVVTSQFERVHVLAFDDDERAWKAIADAAFVEPAIVGRGGIELELSTSTLVDPLSKAMFGLDDEPTSLVVSARREGRVVGVIAGRLVGNDVVVHSVKVALEARGQGVGTHMLKQFVSEAARLGSTNVVPTAGEKCQQVRAFLASQGYVPGVQ